MRHVWRGWSCAAAAALLFWVATPLLAADGQDPWSGLLTPIIPKLIKEPLCR